MMNRLASPARGTHRGGSSWLDLAVRWAVLLAGLQVMFFALLVAGQAVPDNPIIHKLARAVDVGTYGPSSLPDRMGGISDSFTECVVVGTGLGAQPNESALHRAAVMPRISNCSRGASEITALARGERVHSDPYFKYWAGYTPLVRPVVALTGIEGMRLVAGAALVGSFLFAFSALSRTTSWLSATVLLGPLVLASNVMSTPSTAFSNALAMSVALICVGLCAHSARRGVLPAATFAMVSGAAYCYIDLLTNPPLAWMLCVSAAALSTAWAGRSPTKVAETIAATATMWIAGFGLTWVSRWVIAMLWVGPSETLSVIRENVAFRTGGANPSVEPGLGRAIFTNIGYWWSHVSTAPFVLLLLAVAVVAVAVQQLRQGRALRKPALGLLLMVPVAAPVVWYTVMSNHSQIHAFFTYRAVPGAVGVLAAAGVTALCLGAVRSSSESTSRRAAP